MIKKIIVFGLVAAAVLVSVAAISNPDGEAEPPSEPKVLEDEPPKGDVIMPTKVSRPGCEEEDRCYVPSQIVIGRGQQVTWVNEDSAFHSVTSGFYDAPTDLFDSGYMDPFESYTLTFDEAGTYDYFCTLHPWMEGRVVVE